MLDSVVIILSLFAALVCFAIYIVKNRELRNYIAGRADSDDGFPDDCTADGECR